MAVYRFGGLLVVVIPILYFEQKMLYQFIVLFYSETESMIREHEVNGDIVSSC